MKMKEHFTDDFGNLDEQVYENKLGKLLRQKLDRGFVSLRCDTDEIKNYVEPKEQPMNKTIDETLDQRGKNYGDYRDVAYTAQQLKVALRYTKGWHTMEPFMQESMDMICNKMARILNGNPYYDDSWHDIAGYATLVEKQLEKK